MRSVHLIDSIFCQSWNSSANFLFKKSPNRINYKIFKALRKTFDLLNKLNTFGQKRSTHTIQLNVSV